MHGVQSAWHPSDPAAPSPAEPSPVQRSSSVRERAQRFTPSGATSVGTAGRQRAAAGGPEGAGGAAGRAGPGQWQRGPRTAPPGPDQNARGAGSGGAEQRPPPAGPRPAGTGPTAAHDGMKTYFTIEIKDGRVQPHTQSVTPRIVAAPGSQRAGGHRAGGTGTVGTVGTQGTAGRVGARRGVGRLDVWWVLQDRQVGEQWWDVGCWGPSMGSAKGRERGSPRPLAPKLAPIQVLPPTLQSFLQSHSLVPSWLCSPAPEHSTAPCSCPIPTDPPLCWHGHRAKCHPRCCPCVSRSPACPYQDRMPLCALRGCPSHREVLAPPGELREVSILGVKACWGGLAPP